MLFWQFDLTGTTSTREHGPFPKSKFFISFQRVLKYYPIYTDNKMKSILRLNEEWNYHVINRFVHERNTVL